METICIFRRTDLMPVCAMTFRRLKAAGADWPPLPALLVAA
jgi:hypothetical protein